MVCLTHTHAKMPKLNAMPYHCPTVRLRLDQLFNDFSVRTSKWFTCCGPMMRAWEWDGYANASLCTCMHIHMCYACVTVCWLLPVALFLKLRWVFSSSLSLSLPVAVAAASSWRSQLFHKNSLTFNFSKQQLHESEKWKKKICVFLLLCKLIYMRACKTNKNNKQSRRTPKGSRLNRNRERESVWERACVREREHWVSLLAWEQGD